MTRAEQADELVVVHTYDYRHEAEISRSILKAHAIEAIVRADDLGGLQPMLGAANGGVRLLVRRSDEHKAKNLLR